MTQSVDSNIMSHSVSISVAKPFLDVPDPQRKRHREDMSFSDSALEALGNVCSDRILTCRIKSICSPAKVGLVVTDLITSPVVSWRGWETPPPAPRLSCHSLLNHGRVKTSLSVVACYFVVCYALFTFGGWTGFSSTNCL